MENSVTLPARAKINLSIDVLHKRPDSYHEVEMIMQSVELHDTVTVRAAPSDRLSITCGCDCADIPEGSKNIAWKAADLLAAHCGITACSIDIFIEKRIPHAAGLGGGSADAAAVLRALSRVLGLGLSAGDLAGIGVRAGADVPFCVYGGAAVCGGIGEVVRPLRGGLGLPLLIVKPPVDISTAWVYNNLDIPAAHAAGRPDTPALAAALERGDAAFLLSNMKNVLESVSIKHYPVIAELKSELVRLGALASMMSGSGPSVFGVFASAAEAQAAASKLDPSRCVCFLTRAADIYPFE